VVALEEPRRHERQSGSQAHQSEDIEVTPSSMMDDRSQQDTAALQGSTTWAAKQSNRDSSLSDDRTVSSLCSFP